MAAQTLFVLLTLAACCLLYLSHRHQGWLAQPLPPAVARPVRAAGFALLALALLCSWWSFAPLAAVFAWMVLSMMVFSVLPFTALLRKPARGRDAA